MGAAGNVEQKVGWCTFDVDTGGVLVDEAEWARVLWRRVWHHSWEPGLAVLERDTVSLQCPQNNNSPKKRGRRVMA